MDEVIGVHRRQTIGIGVAGDIAARLRGTTIGFVGPRHPHHIRYAHRLAVHIVLAVDDPQPSEAIALLDLALCRGAEARARVREVPRSDP